MADSDPRIVAALVDQLAEWRRALDGGAQRVGWKIGLNVPDVQSRLGLRESVIGHLTSASRLADGGTFAAAGAGDLRVEPEVALHMGAAGEVAGYGPAIEIVDTGDAPPDAAGIVAGNIFHRGFVLGQAHPAMPAGVTGEVRVDDELRASGEAPAHFSDVTELVGRLLSEAGEELRAGDVIIAGSLTPPQQVQPGERIDVGLGPLGSLSVSIEK